MARENLHLILADDDMDDCLLFKEAITELDIKAGLTVVHDGEQLMNLLSNGMANLPDVVFLDLNMPCKNGIECLSEMEKLSLAKPIPVFVFSTAVTRELAASLSSKGALQCFQKPSDYAGLKRIIQQSMDMVAGSSQ
jgi:CheY-like chemotaxis protein